MTSKNLIILQARMESSRLPGKTMMEVGGNPLIYYLVRSLMEVSDKEHIVIATSKNAANDPIREYCKSMGVACYSGSEEDVASRYRTILEARQPKFFHRICGDTPYYDQNLVLEGNEIVADHDLDFVSTMPNKGYPMGCNLELFKTEVFLNGYHSNSGVIDHEHVTAGFYKQREHYTHHLLQCPIENFDYSEFKFSVDTPEDFALAEKMLEAMNYTPWKYTFEDKIKIQQNLR